MIDNDDDQSMASVTCFLSMHICTSVNRRISSVICNGIKDRQEVAIDVEKNQVIQSSRTMKYSVILALAIVLSAQYALCKQPQGEYQQSTESYRHKSVDDWYNDWEKRFKELDEKIPEKAANSPQQEYQRRNAKNYANNIKVNYNNRKDYFLSRPGFVPYTFMMGQESRLNYLGRTYMGFQWQTYKCGSGPYTSFYCGQLDDGSDSGDNNNNNNNQNNNNNNNNNQQNNKDDANKQAEDANKQGEDANKQNNS